MYLTPAVKKSIVRWIKHQETATYIKKTNGNIYRKKTSPDGGGRVEWGCFREKFDCASIISNTGYPLSPWLFYTPTSHCNWIETVGNTLHELKTHEYAGEYNCLCGIKEEYRTGDWKSFGPQYVLEVDEHDWEYYYHEKSMQEFLECPVHEHT